MLKLMKYELRKTMFSKIVMLVATMITELLFLGGVFLKHENALGIGTVGLILCASVGIMYIGIESMIVLHRDLNTKQSYMLFLTPNSSYEILGAKVVENGISILIAGAFYAALAALDVSIAVLYIGGLKEFMNILSHFSIDIQVIGSEVAEAVLSGFLLALASWLMFVMTGYLAIILSATVLAGKKLSGFTSFVLYFIIGGLSSWILNLEMELIDFKNVYLEVAVYSLSALVLIAVMYLVSCHIMERRLSV